MASLFTVNWLANSTTAVAPLQTGVAGVSLVLNAGIHTNPFTGVNQYQYIMPPYNVRKISLTSAGNASNATFTIIAQDPYGNVLTPFETLVGPNADTVDSLNAYYKVLALIPNAVPGAQVSAGYADGYTQFYQVDRWNKASLYSLSYENVVGVIALQPQFTLDVIQFFQNGVQTSLLNWFNPVTQPAIQKLPLLPDTAPEFQVVAPGGIADPINGPLMVNISNFSFTAINTFVQAATVGSFTMKILQQGAKY